MHSPIQTYRNQNQLHLTAMMCLECQNIIFPLRTACNQCLNHEPTKFQTLDLPTTGTIYSFTTIHKPPTQFKKYAPYHVAIIQLSPLPNNTTTIKLTGQLIHSTLPIAIGTPVHSAYRILHSDDPAGHINYGIKWKITPPQT